MRTAIAEHVRPLSNDEIFHLAPSVFATQAADYMTSRYQQVPTIEVVNVLRDKGFIPVRAQQSRFRVEGRQNFCRHMLRFRPQDYLDSTHSQVGDEIPEVVITNSHDGTSKLNASLGIFRLACSNGLVVCSTDFGSMSVRHVGGPDFKKNVLDVVFQVAEHAPKVLEKIDLWKTIELDEQQRLAFAEKALGLLDKPVIHVSQLLQARRWEDRNNSLWALTNTVQEHLLKGGLQGRNEKGGRSTMRAIKSVDRDVRLNKAIWSIAEGFATASN